MHQARMKTLLAPAVMAACMLAALPAEAEDYPYPGVFMNFDRKTYEAFSPTLKDVACYEQLFVQDEKGDFTTYVLDGLQWLRDRKIVYLVESSGHCDFFARAASSSARPRTPPTAARKSRSTACLAPTGSGSMSGCTSRRRLSSPTAARMRSAPSAAAPMRSSRS